MNVYTSGLIKLSQRPNMLNHRDFTNRLIKESFSPGGTLDLNFYFVSLFILPASLDLTHIISVISLFDLNNKSGLVVK